LEEEGEDVIEEDSDDVMPITKMARKTTTSLLLNQAQERGGLDGTNIPALIRHWRCENLHCGNNGKPCCIFDGKHHDIMSNQLAVWDCGIKLGDIDNHQAPTGNDTPPGQQATPSQCFNLKSAHNALKAKCYNWKV